MSIDYSSKLRDGTLVHFRGENSFRAHAIIQGGKGEASHYLLVGTIGSSECNDMMMSALYEIQLHANSTAHEARLLHFFVDWILEKIAGELGLEDKDNEPWIEYHWRSFSLTKL